MRPHTITLRKVENCGNTRWVVDRQENGKRKRSFFESRGQAEAEIARLKVEVKETGAAYLSLPANQREEITRLFAAASEKGHDFVSMLRAFSSEPAAPKGNMTLRDGFTSYLQHLTSHGRAHLYVKNVQHILGGLVMGRGGALVSSLTKDLLVQWLDGRKGWTRATMLTRVKAFCAHAKREGWIVTDPAENLTSHRIVSSAPAIFSVHQHETALNYLAANPRSLAWYVLGTMCGLRPTEAERMSWEKIRTELPAPHLRVEAATSKVRQRRVVYIEPAAARWLAFAKKQGSLLPLGHQSRRRDIRKLREHLGMEAWSNDITRHTAASYWLALTENASALAESMGHRVETLKRHYRAVVTREEAALFWAILPPEQDGTLSVDFTNPQPQVMQ